MRAASESLRPFTAETGPGGETVPLKRGMFQPFEGMFPQSDECSTEKDGTLPKKDERSSQRDGTFPQSDERSTETDGTFPKKDECSIQRAGTFPKADGTSPQTAGTFPQRLECSVGAMEALSPFQERFPGKGETVPLSAGALVPVGEGPPARTKHSPAGTDHRPGRTRPAQNYCDRNEEWSRREAINATARSTRGLPYRCGCPAEPATGPARRRLAPSRCPSPPRRHARG